MTVSVSSRAMPLSNHIPLTDGRIASTAKHKLKCPWTLLAIFSFCSQENIVYNHYSSLVGFYVKFPYPVLLEVCKYHATMWPCESPSLSLHPWQEASCMNLVKGSWLYRLKLYFHEYWLWAHFHIISTYWYSALSGGTIYLTCSSWTGDMPPPIMSSPQTVTSREYTATPSSPTKGSFILCWQQVCSCFCPWKQLLEAIHPRKWVEGVWRPKSSCTDMRSTPASDAWNLKGGVIIIISSPTSVTHCSHMVRKRRLELSTVLKFLSAFTKKHKLLNQQRAAPVTKPTAGNQPVSMWRVSRAFLKMRAFKLIPWVNMGLKKQ